MSELHFEYDINNIINKPETVILLDSKVQIKLKHNKVVAVEVSEKIKTLDYYQELIQKLIDLGVHRNSHLIVIGGGTLSDLGGFIASTLYRGIKWSVIPTTLLSQVDAAIGGKTAVNFNKIKNTIGTFYLPEEIIINHNFLTTLSDKELISGKGEMVKYAFLDKEIFLSIINRKPLPDIIKKCALYKRNLVQEDFKEEGHRIILNLGHTLGHAIESSTNYPHGIAVILGLKLVINMFHPDLHHKFESILEHLDIDIKKYHYPDFKLLKSFIIHDKKKLADNKIQMVIPEDIGLIEVKKISLEDLYHKLDQAQ